MFLFPNLRQNVSSLLPFIQDSYQFITGVWKQNSLPFLCACPWLGFFILSLTAVVLDLFSSRVWNITGKITKIKMNYIRKLAISEYICVYIIIYYETLISPVTFSRGFCFPFSLFTFSWVIPLLLLGDSNELVFFSLKYFNTKLSVVKS